MFTALIPGAIGIRNHTLPEAVALAAATGFQGVAFDVREAARLAEEMGIEAVRALFTGAGVRPAYWGLPVAYRTGTWERELEALPALARLARDLGCPRATTGITPGSDDLTFAENMAWHLSRLQPIAAALAEAGCVLGIEFIGTPTYRAPFTHEFIYSLAGLMDLIARLDAGNVGVLLDSWHLYASGETLDAMDSLSARDVVVVHVNDAPPGIPIAKQIDTQRRLPMETGVLDLPGFIAKLRTIGYDGPVAPEPFDAALAELGVRDPLAAAKQTAHSMRELQRIIE